MLQNERKNKKKRAKQYKYTRKGKKGHVGQKKEVIEKMSTEAQKRASRKYYTNHKDYYNKKEKELGMVELPQMLTRKFLIQIGEQIQLIIFPH